jgi:arginine decarboxylase
VEIIFTSEKKDVEYLHTKNNRKEMSHTRALAHKKKKNGFKKMWKLGIEEVNTAHFDINDDGELIVREGNYQYNIHDIVKKYGTSTEIVFPTIIENRVRDMIETFNAYIKVLGYKGKYHYHYPMKVNQNKEVVLPAVAEGANLEVASSNELFLVKRMIEQDKFNNKIRVICNGPKTERYIELIEELKNKGLTVIPIIEDMTELERMRKFKGEVGIRVDLDVKVDSHWDKRFNRFGFTEDELLSLGTIKNLSILHYHISSQIEYVDGFIKPLQRALHLYTKMREKNAGLDTLNIGGGVGIPYNKNKNLYNTKNLIQKIVRTAKDTCDKLNVKHPSLICEWGRYAVAPSQMTIYKIIAEKDIAQKGKHKWYVIDGSFMNDLTDTWAIHQKWHVIPVNNMKHHKLQHTWLAGSSCDSDDKYTAGGTSVPLPKLSDCDLPLYIAVLDTGAYQDSLASHHCMLSSPLKLLATNGEMKVIRKREAPEDVGKQFGW